MSSETHFEFRSWPVTKWILVGLSILWFGLSIPAVQQLRTIASGAFGPMDWLSVGIIAIHVLFLTFTIRAWLSGKTDNVVVEKFQPLARSRMSVATDILMFLAAYSLIITFDFTLPVLLLAIPGILISFARIRRERNWLAGQSVKCD